MAAGDSQRKILCYDTTSHRLIIDEWVFHSARINCLAWSPDSQHCVSGSLDTNVEVWSVKEPMKHIAIKNAHLDAVTGVAFLEDDLVVSAGADACIKIYKLNYA